MNMMSVSEGDEGDDNDGLGDEGTRRHRSRGPSLTAARPWWPVTAFAQPLLMVISDLKYDQLRCVIQLR
jgi:hypothetical protein